MRVICRSRINDWTRYSTQYNGTRLFDGTHTPNSLVEHLLHGATDGPTGCPLHARTVLHDLHWNHLWNGICWYTGGAIPRMRPGEVFVITTESFRADVISMLGWLAPRWPRDERALPQKWLTTWQSQLGSLMTRSMEGSAGEKVVKHINHSV